MEQPEPSTPVDTDVQETDSDFACFVKAKDKGEITFTLRAQDATADLVVDFWTMIQARVRAATDAGAMLTEAIAFERSSFGIPVYFPEVFDDPKLAGAVVIAEKMRQHFGRKLAD